MEQRSRADVDALLQSIGEDDSGDEGFSISGRDRSVDEILINHASDSPSPPSSPSRSSPGHPYFGNSVKAVGADDEPFYSSRVLDNHSSFSVPINRSGGINQAGSALPLLFGSGIVPSAKPGAALAAAVAASRAIPTPHAAAIKTRRASIPDTQKSTSETEEEVDSRTGSLSVADVVGGVSVSGVESVAVLEGSYSSPITDIEFLEEKEAIVAPCSPDPELRTVDADGAHSSEYRPIKKSPEVPEVSFPASISSRAEDDGIPSVEKIEDCRKSSVGSHDASSTEISTTEFFPSGIEMNSEEFPSVDERTEKYHGGSPSPEHSSIMTPSCSGNYVDHGDNIGAGGVSGNFDVFADGRDDKSNLQIDLHGSSEDVDFQQEVEVGTSNLQLKSHSSLKPLDLAEEIEKKQASTGMHYEEGAAALPMRLEGVQLRSPLGFFDINSKNAVTRTISTQAFWRDNGSPKVLAVHYNWVALGMSKGSIFVFPFKGNDHHIDSVDGKMISLGLQGDRSNVAVTSLCFNLQGDLLFSGYGDGHCIVWDVQKASALKIVTEHRAPIIHLLYLGSTREFNVLSGDSKGVVKLLQFSVSPWLNRISHTKTLKLLDESTSRVVCMSPLLHDEENTGLHYRNSSDASASANSTMGANIDDGAVVFVTRQSALVAKVSPNVEVYTQIPKPNGVGESVLPYVAWKCKAQPSVFSSDNASNEMSEKVSMLAIAWDQTIQVVKLMNFKRREIRDWTIDHGVMGVTWLGDQMLAVITLTGKLYLFTEDGVLIHQTSFSLDEFQGNELISYHQYFSDSLGNHEKAYHNSVAVRGATIYLIGHENLIVCRLLSWKERIEVLWKAGDWEGALNTGIAIYDGRSRGVVDLPRISEELQRIVIPYLVELVNMYISEVFSYISVAGRSQNPMLDQSDDIKDQYVRAGGVAVEYCLHIKKTDILFDHIMPRFFDAQQKETFLELLEPYILKDMLGSLPPAVMQALVEYYSRRGWLQRIEQCILHMDILSLDFNQVILLCRQHGLHRALIYLFNRGLDDFRTPLEELLAVLQTRQKEDAASLLYRVLVYLKYCFQGLAFPPGHGHIPLIRLPSLRKDLLHFLLDDSNAQKSCAITSLPSADCTVILIYLLKLDTAATLEVLKCAFTDISLTESTHTIQELNYFREELAESHNLVQKVVDVFCRLVEAWKFQTRAPVPSCWPSRKDRGHIYDFTAYYVACERASVSRGMVTQILDYLTEEVAIWDAASAEDVAVFKRREKQLLSLLYVLPETLLDTNYLLHLAERVQFHQVCGYIHALNHRDVAAVDSYLKVMHEPIHAFSFIHDRLSVLSGDKNDTFAIAVISRFSDLVKLSREGSFLLIIHHFLGNYQDILYKLHLQPESLFLLLKTIVEVHRTGTLNLSRLEKYEASHSSSVSGAQQQSGGVQDYLDFLSCSQRLLRNNHIILTDELLQQYVELLCQYDPESVLHYLESSEGYSLESCLRLCKEYGIADAASYLLERAGDVGSALLLNLSLLGPKFVVLENTIQKDCSDGVVNNLNAIQDTKLVAEILYILHMCIGLCKRNSPRLKPEESDSLWFQLLDFFFEPMTASHNGITISEGEEIKYIQPSASINEEELKFRWHFSINSRKLPILRKLFTIFIKEIVEGMIGYVQLPKILLKILSVGDQEFGDVKLIILGLLGTYDFEKRILDTAKSLIEDDTYYIMSLLRKRASHGYSPRSFLCCICNSVTSKSFEFQIFSCGHAVHLDCNTTLGCPICLSQKKDHGASSILSENGLVNRSASGSKQAGTTSNLYYYDRESSENSVGLPPISRISLLHNIEKGQNSADLENMPQLRLAPPALYYEKVKKGVDVLAGKHRAESNGIRHPSKPNLKESSDRVFLKSKMLKRLHI